MGPKSNGTRQHGGPGGRGFRGVLYLRYRRWVLLGHFFNVQNTHQHAPRRPSTTSSRLGGRISSGASAPKPATEPRSLIFEAFWGSFWLHFGTPRASKNKVFVWRVLHFSKNRGVRTNQRNLSDFEAFWGSCWLHFGTPRASKNKVFVWRVLHFSKNRGVRKNRRNWSDFEAQKVGVRDRWVGAGGRGFRGVYLR